MVLIVEMDNRSGGVYGWRWLPGVFRGRWNSGTTWRIWWGLWSVSYYPERGLREFFDYVELGRTEWRDET